MLYGCKFKNMMTRWALIALLRAGYQGEKAREAIAGGIQLLKDRQLPNGDWPEEAVAGVFFNTAMLHYRLYKNYFPIWAPGLLSFDTYPRQKGEICVRGRKWRGYGTPSTLVNRVL
jgi:hypothetical protein